MRPPWWFNANRARQKRKARADEIGLRYGFRSGLEEALADQIKAAGHPVLFELFKINYVVPEQTRRYTPDFELGNGIIVEAKGIWDATDRAKMLLVRAQYPELDIRMIFHRAKQAINPGSQTSCAQWADKHGIKWAEKHIPESWFAEPGPKRKPREVLKNGPYQHAPSIA